MGFKKLLWLGTVSGLAVACTAAPAFAQQAGTSEPQEIVVTGGYLKSLQDAIEQKKQADGVVEAVSASDIGQLPDKNVADALQRLPGITTQTSAAAGAGGFGENDRVAIRGTAPNLTQTLLNGHAVGTGDWFILDQLDAASRSVTYSMFPSEIVDHAIVYKSSQADQVEGGSAGTIDIVTRTPLGFKDQYTAEASLGGAYGELAGKAGYQLNGIVNWKNDANNFGVMIQGFDEDRFLRRDGQEVLGYTKIPSGAGSAYPTALQGALVPSIINNALFTQERHRFGGNVAVEYQPTDKWDFKVDAFLSRLLAPNYNQGDLIDVADEINKGVVPSTYTVSNGAVTSASFPGSATIGQPGINDISRPHAASYSEYINADGTWKATSNLKIHFAGGYTQGEGKTDQMAYGTSSSNTPFSYSMSGTGPITTAFPGATGLNNPANYAAFNGDGNQDWVGLTQLAQLDREGYGQVDVSYYLDTPIVNEVDGGFRYTQHNRHETFAENYGCYSGLCSPNLASVANGTFPSNFGSGAGITAPFNLSVDQSALDKLVSNMIATTGKTPQQRAFGGGPYGGAYFDITEDTIGGYVMAHIGGTNWKGNVGVRIVNTKDDITTYDSVPENPSIKGVTYSDFGPWYANPHTQNYTDILPSLSLSYDIAPNHEVHLSASETMTRPDYYALAGGITLNDTLLTGTVGNPTLKPTRSSNVDLSWEWYFAPKSLISVGLFNMRMESDFDAVTIQEREVNLQQTQNPVTNPCPAGPTACPVYSTYSVQTINNNSGYSRGVEFSYQQPIAYGFGTVINYTYTDSAQNNETPGIGGTTMLGASRHTANFTGYYDNGPLNAHLSYTRHSSIYQGIDRGNKYFQDDGGSLDGAVNYQITKNFGVNVDVLNIADEKDRYVTGALPRAIYDNGRTIYFSLNAKY